MRQNTTVENTQLFTQSDLFFDQLQLDIEQAEQSILIQCMSFEADQVGTKLIELLIRKPNLNRTLLIDHYSLFVVNDVFLANPLNFFLHRKAYTERKALTPLLQKAKEHGIIIHFTNPMGVLLRNYPKRNHKKNDPHR